ncbi:hypothetical protein FE257_001745 [Aspergillus nanangensis]|uniref:Uncharacterized protein n=1 Tax=Aspergillus nanangensis TaxID=2582783 RepID=A0AAD4CDJ0_ASPNN|nr:hypothetical protein FE257_001745 [Aspergillus nanangensis]
MDIVQKHGHLKRSSEDSAQPLDAHIDHLENQQAVNNLLGNFGQPHHDHPDRKSSGAANMSTTMQELNKKLSEQESAQQKS